MNELHGDAMQPEDEDVYVLDEPTPHLPDLNRLPDPKLVAEGWERRFMIDKRRIEEFNELYRSLGYEVRAEAVRPEEVDLECGDCALVMYQIFVTLYTRRSGSSAQSG